AAIIVLSVILAWVHYRVANWHRQQPAIVALEWAGGRVQYTSILPEWIRELMNDSIGRPFDEVISVDLSYTKASDDDLCQLELLPTIRSLDLAQMRVSNSGLRHINHLDRLMWLSLDDTQISDAGLVHLKTLRSLECLGLDKTRVEGFGLIHLQGLEKLNIISVRDGPLGDSGLQHLTALPRLWTVYTSGSRVSRAGADVFRERSHNHIFVEYRYAADFGSGTSTSLGAGDADPFR